MPVYPGGQFMEGGVGVGGDGDDGEGDVTVGGAMMGMAEGCEVPGTGEVGHASFCCDIDGGMSVSMPAILLTAMVTSAQFDHI